MLKAFLFPKFLNNSSIVDKAKHWSVLLFKDDLAIRRQEPELNHGIEASRPLSLLELYIRHCYTCNLIHSWRWLKYSQNVENKNAVVVSNEIRGYGVLDTWIARRVLGHAPQKSFNNFRSLEWPFLAFSEWYFLFFLLKCLFGRLIFH
jgi:hypothetical protein